MVSGRVRVELTKEEILKRTDEWSIYRYYLGEDFKLGEVLNSPMPGRRDIHPSFLIGCRAGFLYHVDFADSKFKGNCFQFVMQKEMLPNYNSALRRIDKDFNLGISAEMTEVNQPVFITRALVETKPKFFQVSYTSSMTLEERRYWEQYYITPKELKDNEVYAVRRFLIDRQVQPLKRGELCFGYKLGSLWKIYKPKAYKDRKWLGNIPLGAVEGMEEIKEASCGIITKSRKDRILLKKLIPNVVSVQNESLAALSPESAEIISNHWLTPYVNYDADKLGKENSWAITQKYCFLHLNVPDKYLEEGIKDFSDMAMIHGLDSVYKYLQSKNIV